MNRIEIETEFIKLDQLLKFIGIADNGAFAKMIILNGDVKLNGEIAKERGKKVRKGDTVEVANVGIFQIY